MDSRRRRSCLPSGICQSWRLSWSQISIYEAVGNFTKPQSPHAQDDLRKGVRRRLRYGLDHVIALAAGLDQSAHEVARIRHPRHGSRTLWRSREYYMVAASRLSLLILSQIQRLRPHFKGLSFLHSVQKRVVNYLLYKGSYKENCGGGWLLAFHTFNQKEDLIWNGTKRSLGYFRTFPFLSHTPHNVFSTVNVQI